ncbi:DUF1501 domain-containing protein [Colwellia psychrerythraea]|uniref:DUF1501 domain-containing protein n=1 Tax=Colwellia psychrerythraea (strain 34H / ATCC BAA-681) TaxID=167879 RepID=Q482A8_COLP3|nr:DUF1501 domain-containing protein [Colwellia psychrerythraea]AAZ28269.1 hypothetical protein CPS_2392 [Colwellia psychrerythraea 34H]
MQRRQFIKSMAATLVLFKTPNAVAKALSATSPKSGNKKIIWVVLRGAMDSLHTLVPTFDTELSVLRPKLLASIKDDLLMLDNGFALHPSLSNLHQWYKKGELLPITAVSSGYAKRSHFDGQDYLESGLTNIDHDTGWLGRAVNMKEKQALAIANSTPISLRSSEASTWYPSQLKEADEDVYQALMKMYQNDELLINRLEDGLAVKEMADTMVGDRALNIKKKGQFIELSKSCANLMMGNNGVDCAMLELGGWDTHNNQATRLSRQLKALDQGLKALKDGLKDQWQDTVVVVATEFGRTVKENGTGGTDHGTASAMFIAGGSVNGGKVLGNWPGLKNNQLFEQRDLMPTSNTFSWLATVVSQQWSLSDNQLKAVFPHVDKRTVKLFVG